METEVQREAGTTALVQQLSQGQYLYDFLGFFLLVFKWLLHPE